MIQVTDTRGGYELRRDDDPPQAESFFVRDSELPALIAELLARETAEADAWDLFAYFCGNDQAVHWQAVRP
jgi:hypothetical protein